MRAEKRLESSMRGCKTAPVRGRASSGTHTVQVYLCESQSMNEVDWPTDNELRTEVTERSKQVSFK